MGIVLSLQVLFVRAMQRLSTLADNRASPKPPQPTFSVTIPTQSAAKPGCIPLYFYTPSNYNRAEAAAAPATQRRPLVVNFHGGGFTIGHAKDDGRWVAAILSEVDAVVVSVGYRKAPKYPQPTAVQDGVDALRWLWAHATEYGFDPMRTVVTGFSAGGNLSLAVPLRHYLERKDQPTNAAVHDGRLAGIAAFYPSVDQSLSRDEKKQSNPISIAKGSIPAWLYRMFDAAYYRDMLPKDRTSLNLSPALASTDVLKDAFPAKLAIYTCEWDMLLVEAEDFRKRLQAVGKTTGGYMVENEAHGFDKFPQKDSSARDDMYRDAVEQIKPMVDPHSTSS